MIQTKDILKSFFRRRSYPSESNFFDLIDSFFHKSEKIPVSAVNTLPELLNGKYEKTDGATLEQAINTQQGKIDRFDFDIEQLNNWNNAVEQRVEELSSALDQKADLNGSFDTMSVGHAQNSDNSSNALKLGNELPEFYAKDAELFEIKQAIQALNGAAILIGTIELQSTEVSNALLHARALELRGNIQKGYTLKDSNHVEWWCESVSEDTSVWNNIGQNIIGRASSSVEGVVKGSAEQNKVQILSDGTMSVNKVNAAVTADSATLVGLLHFSDVDVSSLNFFWGTVGGTTEQRLCSKERLKAILSEITTVDWSAKNITANGMLATTSSGRTTTIYSINEHACHYVTDAPCHLFNKSILVNGDILGGSDESRRRAAYIDEIAGIKVANASNADTAGRLAAGAWEIKESGGELLIMKSGVTIAKFNDTGIVSMRDVTANV